MNNSEYFYNTETVKQAAQGKWLAILAIICPPVEPAIQKLGRHVACPMHEHRSGAKNRDFRFPRNADQTGCAFCSRETWSDGFELIKAYHGCDFDAAKTMVGDALGLDPIYKRSAKEKEKPQQKPQSAPARRPRDSEAGEHEETQGVDGSDSTSAPDPEATPETSGVNEASAADTVSEGESDASGNRVDESQSTGGDDALPVVVERGAAEKALQSNSYLQPRANTGPDDGQLEQFRESNWKEAVDLRSDHAAIARQYLAYRKIPTLRALQDVRFHPKLLHVSEDREGQKVKRHYPAIVSAVRAPDGEMVSVHRTYLRRRRGKFKTDKKMMALPSNKTITGAAIRMVPAKGNILGVAEGLETAASAYRATGIPVWATISAHGLETVVIPEGVDTVLVWADKDKSLRGEQAAEVLTDRLQPQGIKVITLVPSVPIPKGEKSVDWNDVLIHQGLFGFPRRNELLRYAERSDQPRIEQGIA